MGVKDAHISDTTGDWTSVYESRMSDQDEAWMSNVASRLSGTLPAAVVAFLVHDSDVFRYWLFEGGKQLDAYNPCSGYIDDGAGGQREGRPTCSSVLQFLVSTGKLSRPRSRPLRSSRRSRSRLLRSCSGSMVSTHTRIFGTSAADEATPPTGELMGRVAQSFAQLFNAPASSQEMMSLMDAIERHDLASVRSLVKGGCDPNGIGPWKLSVPGLSGLAGMGHGAAATVAATPSTQPSQAAMPRP